MVTHIDHDPTPISWWCRQYRHFSAPRFRSHKKASSMVVVATMTITNIHNHTTLRRLDYTTGPFQE